MKKYYFLFFVAVLLTSLSFSPLQSVQAVEGVSLDVAKQAALNEL
ncbi:hypothetical protein ACOI1C_13420 [Bacillus sp. DJP31]